MGLKSIIGQIAQDGDHVAFRPSEAYLVATGAYTIFNMVQGPFRIVALGGIIRAAAVGATEVRVTVNGVNVDAAAVAINGAVGTVIISSLNVAGTMLNAAAAPETVATQSNLISGIQAAAIGTIVATYSVGTSATMEWFVVYRKLSPSAKINVA